MKRISGLTLIEVLIALSIVAIALTAVIKATSQGLRGTGYLQHKTIATWIAQETVNNIIVNVIKLRKDEVKTKQINFLNNDWFWQAQETETSNPHINKLKVDVFDRSPDDETNTPLLSMEAYRYHAE